MSTKFSVSKDQNCLLIFFTIEAFRTLLTWRKIDKHELLFKSLKAKKNFRLPSLLKGVEGFLKSLIFKKVFCCSADKTDKNWLKKNS